MKVSKRKSSGKKLAVISAAAGQGLAFLASLILARVYSPTDFGNFVVFISVFNVATIILAGRYDQAINYETSEQGLIEATTFAVFVAGITATLAIVLNSTMGLLWSSLPSMAVNMALLSAWAGILCRIAAALYVQSSEIGSVATLNVCRPFSIGAAQVILALMGFVDSGLMYGHALANVVLCATILIKDYPLRRRIRYTRLEKIFDVAKRHANFAKYSLPQNLLFVMSDALIPLSLAYYYTPAVAGIYLFAARLTTAPIIVLVDSVRTIITREFVSLVSERREHLCRWILTVSALLALPFLAGSLLMAIRGPVIIEFIFGKEWVDSASIIAILLLAGSVSAAGVPYISAAPLVSAQQLHFRIELIVTGLKVLVLVQCAGRFNSVEVVFLIALTSAIAYISFFVRVFLRIKWHSRSWEA